MTASAASNATTRYSCWAGSAVTASQAATAASKTANDRLRATDVVSQPDDGGKARIGHVSLTTLLRSGRGWQWTPGAMDGPLAVRLRVRGGGVRRGGEGRRCAARTVVVAPGNSERQPRAKAGTPRDAAGLVSEVVGRTRTEPASGAGRSAGCTASTATLRNRTVIP
jgi:hypothetical protein